MKTLLMMTFVLGLAAQAVASDCSKAALTTALAAAYDSGNYAHCGSQPIATGKKGNTYYVTLSCIQQEGAGIVLPSPIYQVKFLDNETCGGGWATKL